jgi:peptide/nickel transport system substrate-binding protein
LSTRRTQRLLAVAVGLSLVAAACGDDDDTATDDEGTAAPADTEAPAATDAPTDATAAPEGTESPGTTAAGTDTTTGGTGEEPAAGGGMTLTIDIAPEAVWQDGSPITVADLECSWRAALNTPGSIISGQGYNLVTAVSQGDSDKQAVIEFSETYGPYKTMFDRIIQASAVENCDDISGDFSTEQPLSGQEWVMESWSAEQSIFVPNENYWGDAPVVERAVMVPQTDQETEIASLLAGQIDFIYPQFTDSLATALDDPNIELGVELGGDYEAIHFQQLEGPLADPIFREALSKSIDREALFNQIYVPIFEAAGTEGELLNCGAWTPGPYCPDDAFQDTYDPEGAEALLTENGWEKNGEGFWAKDGTAPEIRWMINAGNLRRENAQDYLIPLLAQAGFNVVADNGTADEVFQQRLPGMDFDMAMYIQTPKPDPGELTPVWTCDQIPTEENNFQGQNTSGWCNEEATAALYEADRTADPDARAELVKTALRLQDTDHVLLPLAQYPRSGAWRTDKVGGPVGAEVNNPNAFNNFAQWEDVDGDGQIVIGAEQWPACLNPVTECANSSWSVWTSIYPVLPSVWNTTSTGEFEPSALVVGEPVVETEG